jgi:hypothetical protein
MGCRLSAVAAPERGAAGRSSPRMATTSTLRLRRSAAQLHALAQVEREIRATDHNGRRKYLRDFREAFRTYESVLTPAQLDSALCSADAVLIGDYHALPAAQAYAAQLVRRLAANSTPLVLGIEMIFARDQHILDEWLRGEISESELRERIRFDLEWGYEWQPVYEVLQSGRENGAAIYGLDFMPHSDMRRIVARDRHAAMKITEVRGRHPEAVLVVLFGESHLAPNHLPQLLRERLSGESILTVLQNVDALYWKAAGERRECVDAVRVDKDVVCVFNSTPLEKYESYRLCIERWRHARPKAPDPTPAVYNLVDALLRFFNINKYSATNHTQPKFLVDVLPEVYCRTGEEAWRKLLLHEGAGGDEIRSVLTRLEQRGSCYLPAMNALCVQDLRMLGAAEEVARFVHHACRNELGRLDHAAQAPEDAFYQCVIENAVGYLGSRVVFPKRQAVRESELYALYSLTREAVEEQSSFAYREYMQMIDFLVLHKDWEANHQHYVRMPALLEEGQRWNGERFEFVTRQLGYMLGSELYHAYVMGRVGKRFLRALLFRKIGKPGAGRELYFATVRKIRTPRPRLV